VTILAPEGDETFELGPGEEAALPAAMAEGARGVVISAAELFLDLGRGAGAALRSAGCAGTVSRRREPAG
jgi:hypothetical protein